MQQRGRVDSEVVLQVDDVVAILGGRLEHTVLGVRQSHLHESDQPWEAAPQELLGHLVVGVVDDGQFGEALSQERLCGIKGEVSEDVDGVHDCTCT